MTALADRLAGRTLELVDIRSVSRSEDAIRAHLLSLVPTSLAAEYAGDEAYLFVPVVRRDVPLVVLAGHYDTIPEQDNLPGEIRDGAVHGLGASDMKGGVAVAIGATGSSSAVACDGGWIAALLSLDRLACVLDGPPAVCLSRSCD